jgi:hypothetical protein
LQKNGIDPAGLDQPKHMEIAGARR